MPNNCACHQEECMYCYPPVIDTTNCRCRNNVSCDCAEKALKDKCAMAPLPEAAPRHGLHCGPLLTKCHDVQGHYGLSRAEPPPMHSTSPAIWDLVVKDMVDRDASGFAKYGTRLQAHNGRDVLTDAYQEALDLAVYLRQSIYERDGK